MSLTLTLLLSLVLGGFELPAAFPVILALTATSPVVTPTPAHTVATMLSSLVWPSHTP